MLISFCLGAGAALAESTQERLNDATTLFTEIMATPDRSIPQDLLQKASCIVLVPGVKKAVVSYERRNAVTRDDTGALVAQHPQRLAAVGNAATVLAGAPGCIRGLSTGECQDGDCQGCCS